MKKKFLFVLFVLSILGVDAKQLEADLFSKNAILVNMDSGVVLYNKKAEEKAYPASITKIATALYILNCKQEFLNDKLKAAEEALYCVDAKVKIENNYNCPAYWLEHDGVSFFLQKGENISVKSLLYALMLGSYNDCANVLAEGMTGSIQEFMKRVNEYLVSLGCVNTQFLNPHGLHHPDHYTTAADMALITRKAMDISMFRRIVSTISYTTSRERGKKEAVQSNRLLKKGKYFYPFATGVKTGYHSSAGYNLVATAENEDRKLLAVLMGAKVSENRYIDAKRLFEAAFAEKKEKKEIFESGKIFEANIEGAADIVKAGLNHGLFYEYYPSEEEGYRIFIKWDNFKLPLKKDERVGVVKLMSKESGRELSEEILYSTTAVNRKFSFAAKQFFQKFFSFKKSE